MAGHLPGEELEVLDGTFLETLRRGRIFLTGGTGFVGTWLLEYLHRKDLSHPLDLRVEVLSRDPRAFLEAHPRFASWPALHLVQGDVRTLDPRSVSADWILHGATSASRKLNDASPLDMIEVIVKGTEAVLEAARHCRPRRLLFLSSGLAYGTQSPEVEAMGEDGMGHLDALDPRAAYGNAKHFAEHLCLQSGQAHGFEVGIARCFAFVGPLLPLDTHFAVGNFLRDGLQGRPIRIQGDGTPLRSYLHAAELAHWLWTILVRGGDGRAYNVGAREAVSIRELAEYIGGLCGVPVEVARRPEPGARPARYVPCIERAREELGLEPIFDWRDAVARTLAWHRAARTEVGA